MPLATQLSYSVHRKGPRALLRVDGGIRTLEIGKYGTEKPLALNLDATESNYCADCS